MDAWLVSHYLAPFMSAVVAAFGLSALVRYVYIKRGWVDNPADKKQRKVVHTYPVPRGGGLAIFGAILLVGAFFLDVDKHLAGILLGAGILALMGFLDDVADINPYLRLLGGLLAALAVVGVGIGIAYITNPFGEGVIHLSHPQVVLDFLGRTRTIWILADALALVWIVWCMNMINWSKGLDGQLPGVVVIAAIVIGLLSLRFGEDVTQWSVTVLSAITAGAFLGFLPWNWFPQKMMPGYGGGTLGGYFLAVLSILSGAKLATLILALAVPMLDAIFVIARRISQGKSPVWGDDGHLHHRLLKVGWGKRRIALFYWGVTLITGLLALQLNAREKVFTIVLFTLAFPALLLWLNYFITSSRQPGQGNGLKT
jgi:UDP-GlcNAc:undecaprenyl-phosphate/decaprenyl-phosphate GlcNAc-1-phosphate transferase